tara:strand:- start:13394 stop:14701 length:1308 start_codon:yes stop_codon:yes gene_type:complete
MQKFLKSINNNILCFIYILFLHLNFESYAVEVFSYAYYFTNKPSFFYISLIFLIALLPVNFIKNKSSLYDFFIVIYYLLIYIPILIFILHMFSGDALNLFVILVSLFVSTCFMCYITKFSPSNFSVNNKFLLRNETLQLINIITIFFAAAIIYNYWGNFQLVGLNQIYDLRLENSSINRVPLINYIVPWATSVLVPIHSILYLKFKKLFSLFSAAFLLLLIFMSVGAKIAFVTPLAVYFLYISKGKNLLSNLLYFFIIFNVLIFILPNTNEIIFYVKSLLYIRTFGISGWTFIAYYEYFNIHGPTFMSHVGFLNSIFDYYPYSEQYELGQLIGKYFYGSPEANYNANYLVSDGIAGLGIYGIALVNILVSLFIFVISHLLKRYDDVIVLSFSTGFFTALTNAPFFVSLMTGGMLLMLLLFFFDWIIFFSLKNIKT